ncbi:serine/threonine-protein kinase [Rhizobium sp. LjRoot30]|uniref:serine/threonine-protein kinase n=1 Tax=Rhizobium sp. LjRoot30 TaxID=3342320 RepID=UPI003ECDF4F9
MTETSPPACLKLLRQAGGLRVYEALSATGQPMVVKHVFRDTESADPIGARRFEREKRLASTLRHPQLAVLLEEGGDWLGFEYLQPSLAAAGQAARFGDGNAVGRLLGTLAEAVAYLHARGVVHGDIKPSHILFRGEEPVLIDFGIAALTADDPLGAVEFAGTPAWMAPEQLSGEVGPPADIWALSAVGLWLLTGERPFSGESEEIIRKRRLGAVLEFDFAAARRQADPDLVAALARGLGPPESRPAARELAAICLRR